MKLPVHNFLCRFALAIAIATSLGCTDKPSETVGAIEPKLASIESELDALITKAQRGDVEAQFQLAGKYVLGEGVSESAEIAFQWYEKASAQNHVKAQLELGKAYYFGRGTPKDPLKAIRLYEIAAANGILEAKYRLGQAYDSGKGVQKDPQKAIALWKEAAEAGHALSQSRIGLAYFTGKGGLNKDEKLASEWFEKAISQNDPEANYSLALSFLTGWSAPKDARKSFELAQLSANAGHLPAKSMLCRQFKESRELQIEMQARNSFCSKAAESGDGESQYELGLMFLRGDGMPQDEAKAAALFSKAATQGVGVAQFQLAELYALGTGIDTDLVLAYAWYNLAASSKDVGDLYNGLVERAGRARNKLAQHLSPSEIREGQELSSSWKKGGNLAHSGSQSDKLPIDKSGLAKREAGTAFVINQAGFAITNNHVVDRCKEVRIEGRQAAVKVVTSDTINDLSLLQFGADFNVPVTISANPAKIRQGDEIVVFGFPLNSVLSSGGNLTPGVVSALTGLGNNTNQLQVTAPIQPGSSGSPVLNRKGEVVGVISKKLSDEKMAQATGQIGQNVNFAVSGQTLKAFLDKHRVDYKLGGVFSFEKSIADIGDEARKSTLVVECWR